MARQSRLRSKELSPMRAFSFFKTVTLRSIALFGLLLIGVGPALQAADRDPFAFVVSLGTDFTTTLESGWVNLGVNPFTTGNATGATITAGVSGSDGTVITDANGLIIQVHTDIALATITRDTTGYTVAVYSPSAVSGLVGGVYQLVAGAIPVGGWRMDASTVGGLARLNFQQMVGNTISGTSTLYAATADGHVAVKPSDSNTETVTVATTLNGQPAYIITETPVVGTTRGAATIRRVYTYAAAAPYTEQPYSTDHPEGNRESYDYALGAYNSTTHVFTPSTDGTGSHLRTITTQGVANDTTPLIAYRSTRTTQITDTATSFVWYERFEIYDGTSFQPVNTTLYTYDATYGALLQKTVDGRVVYSATYTNGLKTSETDETGITTTYDPDDATITTKAGVPAFGNYPALPAIHTTTVSDGTNTITVESSDSGLLTRVSSSGDTSHTEHGLTTTTDTTDDSSGNTVVTTTRPDTGTEIQISDSTGRLLRVTGTAVTAEYHTYGTNTDGTTWERVDYGATTSANYRKTISDVFGRTIIEERPAFAVAGSATAIHQLFYNSKGQLWKETNTGQADRLYEYDVVGNLYRSGFDLNSNGTLDPVSNDMIEQTETAYALESGNWYRVTTQTAYRTSSSSTASVVSITKERLTLDTNMLDQTIRIDAAGGQTTSTTLVDRDHALVTITTTVPGLTAPQIRVTRNGLLQSDQASHQTQPTTYGYDDLGRLQTVTDPRVGTTKTYAYTLDDQLESVTAGSGDEMLVSGMTYIPQGEPGAGQVATRTEAGRTTHYTYDLRGNMLHTWGNTYPVWYEYDSFGRRHKLHTYRTPPSDFEASTWPDGDVTTWNYDEATGLLLSKIDASGHGPSSTYWPSGALKTRTWARAVDGSSLVTSYAYYTTGQLQSITYSDSTPSVAAFYTRDGRPATLTDAAGLRTFAYDAAARMSGEAYSSGELNGLTISNPVDEAYRESSLAVSNGTSKILAVTYAYQPDTGLLNTVTKGTYSVSHEFAPQSNWLNTLIHKAGGSPAVTTTRTPDSLGRISSIVTKLSSATTPFTSYVYHYDAHNQRDTVDLADSSRWTYAYDSFGQVESGSHTQASMQPVLGHAFAYTHDSIGNRLTTTVNHRSAAYTPDLLNRYTQRDVPAAFDVTGEAAFDARVGVNNVLATRTGGTFYAAVPADNTIAPAYSLIDVVAARTQNGADVYGRINNGHLFLPKTPEALVYDDDGNLTQDGRWVYTWDAENRLVKIETRSDVATTLPSLSRQKVEFAYDAYGRRIVKKASTWMSNAWVLNSYHRFVYDGWNLVAEVDAQAANAAVGAYVWGMDLSGTPQGAGGVGGLLLATVGSTYAPVYDGNGNITSWVDLAVGGSVAGQREYGPFGEALRATGAATIVPFGFSSKYTERETGLTYYGHRYYSSSTGRWLSTDPIEEDGGLNLYGFAMNSPIGLIDSDGRSVFGIDSFSDFKSDDIGKALLMYWLSGYGKDQVIESENPQWHHYMTAINPDTNILRSDVKIKLGKIKKDALQKDVGGKIIINEKIRGEFINGEDIIGYHYLHTSNPLVGDFAIKGVATRTDCDKVEFAMDYTWNDIIGPNKNYSTDRKKSDLGGKLSALMNFLSLGASPTSGKPKNYRIEIHFREKARYLGVLPSGGPNYIGWPWDGKVPDEN